MHYVLIDYENVQPDIRPLAENFETDVTVFVGARQRVNPLTDAAVYKMDTRAEVIKIASVGPNALDFHLAFHLGQLVMADPTSTFEILSNDKGYDCLVNQLVAKGIRIHRTRGAHRPREEDGAKEQARDFLPEHLRQKTKTPQKPPESMPLDAGQIRGAIRALEHSLRSLNALQFQTAKTKRKFARNTARLAKLRRSLPIAAVQPENIGSRRVLRLPAQQP